jgi:thiol-disulfide isomerase/thioredoxin
MARTASTMQLELGAMAPGFSLPDYGAGVEPGQLVSIDEVAAVGGKPRPLLVMFICNHCPFVKHVRSELAAIGREYAAKLGIVAINPNDVANHADDRPDLMTVEAQAAGYSFPYLYDESQAVAKVYKAACTPDFYLFDSSRRLVYRGQLDDSRPSSGVPVTGEDLRAAIEAVLAGRAVSGEQRPSLGCNIKWKPGNEPEYYSKL